MKVNRKLLELKYEIIIAGMFVLSRMPSLGHDNFNTDVWKWKARIFDFGSGVFYLDFARTIQKYHPGVTLMWLGTLAVKIYNLCYRTFFGTNPPDNSLTTIFGLDFVQKLFVVIAIGICISCIFYVLRKLFGFGYAGIAVFLISAEPFYVALTRVLHLEGLMSTFMIASFVWLYYFLQDKSKLHRLYVSAIFSSLAVLTKTSALFMAPFSVLVLAMDSWNGTFDYAWVKRFAAGSFRWGLVFCAAFVVMWPAMWTYPIAALETLYRGIFTIGVERGHEQFYFGRLVDDPGPTFYLVVLWLKSSVLAVAGLIGYTYLLKTKKYNRDHLRFMIYLLVFALLYLVELTIPSKKLDRYVLPSLLALVMIAAFFYNWLLLHKHRVLGSTALVIFALYTLVRVHPDYFSYYSLLGGGLRAGINILEPKWIIGAPEIVDFFNRLAASKNLRPFIGDESFAKDSDLANKLTVAFPEKYYTQIWPFIREVGGWAVIADLTPEAKKTKYFVYPVWDDQSKSEDRFDLVFVNSIKIRNVAAYNVYERK